jgi:sigma-E factor negative regulatory protein RseC
MDKSKYIEHPGIIKEISDKNVTVHYVSTSACSKCHAKGFCGPMDEAGKVVEVTCDPSVYQQGEKVNLIMQESLGVKALLLGYMVPFLLVVIILPIMLSLTGNELLSGVIAFTSIIPYYISFYFFKDKLEKTFTFSINKLA